MTDIIDSIIGSDTLQSLQMYLIMKRYPWIPFVVVLIIGVIITLVIMLVRSKKAKKKDSTAGVAVERVVQPSPYHYDAPKDNVTDPIPCNMLVPTPNQNLRPMAQSPAVRSLVCIEGVLKGKEYPIRGTIYIGRDSRKCAIAYPKDTKNVSGVHCCVAWTGKDITVTDEQSTCGTFIDGQKIPVGKATAIHRGQTLSIGSGREAFILKSH